jgi:hypothetical protein
MADLVRWLSAVGRVLQRAAEAGDSLGGAGVVSMCGPNGGPVWVLSAEPRLDHDTEAFEEIPPLTWVSDADGVLLTSNSILRLEPPTQSACDPVLTGAEQRRPVLGLRGRESQVRSIGKTRT